MRLAFVLVSFLLENLWLVLRWAVVARPGVGGRDLPTAFTTFYYWIRHVLKDELNRQWTIEMNGVGIPDSYATAADWLSPRPRGARYERQLSAETAKSPDLTHRFTAEFVQREAAPRTQQRSPEKLTDSAARRNLDWEVLKVDPSSL